MTLFQNITRKNKEIFGIMLIFSLFFLNGGFGTASVQELGAGLRTIVTSPAQLTCDYFALAGMGATYVNAGLVGLACMLVLFLSGMSMNGLSLMAFFLTTGFSFFGMNILNIWPCILGAWLFSRVDGTPVKTHVNIALFSTKFPKWYMNTFLIALAAAVFQTIITLCMSYTLSRFRFKLRKPLMQFMLILGMFPGMLGMIILYNVLKDLGMTGAHAVPGLILVNVAGAGMGYYVSKGFFDTIPKSLD